MKKKTGMMLCIMVGLMLLTACTEKQDTGQKNAGQQVDSVQEESVSGLEGQAGNVEKSTEPEKLQGQVEESIYAAGVTQQQLFQNDFTIYFVNCGTKNKSEITDQNVMGLYQTVTDQSFGEDTGTKRQWGYQNSEYMTAVGDVGAADKISVSWEVNANAEYTEETGFYYDFEVPKGNYEIICGFHDPFSTRKVDICVEEECLVSQGKIFKYETTELVCTQMVTDGILNLCVKNENRGKDSMKNPILTYIIIKAVPEYDRELLQCLLDEQEIIMEERKKYTQNSMSVLESEVIKTMETMEKTVADSTEYKERYIALEKAGESLELAAIRPGEVWKDVAGTLIQAHGGHIQKLKVMEPESGELVEKWWWVGEDKTYGYRGGINAYSSTDLINWTFEGTVMRNVSSREQLETEPYFIDLYGDYSEEQLDRVYECINDTTSVIERPKMIYNEKTGKYIIWFHADGPTATSSANYAAASAGVAVSDSPTGPFKFIDRYRLNTCPENQKDFYPKSKGMARDMNLFIDDDGTAYIIYSSEENLTLYISKLNEEYTYLATTPENAVYGEDFIRIFPGAQREAPALFKRDGKYYLMTSACTGWAPNPAKYAMADSIFGTWTDMGDPCVDDISRTTFYSQSTCIFCYDEERDYYIYMGDRWNSDDLANSRYIWLPISFDEEGYMSISYQEEWLLPQIEMED